MPNTLAHLGIQGLTTRALLPDADDKWIYLGCILPDLPWILQRLVRFASNGVDPYDLRLYCTVQASLLFCLLLSLALAMISKQFWKTFAIVGLNSLLHLLLDACQTKWGNGVHLVAPFNWQLTNFDLFWPESFLTHVLTAFGLVYLIASWRRSIRTPPELTLQPVIRLFAFVALLTAYFSLPFLLLMGPERADSHFVKTLRNSRDRPGRYVEIDRGEYSERNSLRLISTFAGENLSVDNVIFNRSATVSVQGTFVSRNQIHVKEYHLHSPLIRDGSTYLGLTVVAMLWLSAFLRGKIR
ncbi:MAG: hypothetical protein JSU72_18130 [Deltaproteobacteria bacterium]|nr:MAG: hypothetical protein JSU72_18130 [Deltaproteobacteria bacterium]